MQRERDELVDGPYRRDFLTYDNHILDGDIFLQALTKFLMILDWVPEERYHHQEWGYRRWENLFCSVRRPTRHVLIAWELKLRQNGLWTAP